MNKMIILIMIISSVTFAKNAFWDEFDCPKKLVIKKNIIDSSISIGPCKNSLCSYQTLQHRVDSYVCGSDTSIVSKDIIVSFNPKATGACITENNVLRLNKEGTCIISYGSKEDYFFVKKCENAYCTVRNP